MDDSENGKSTADNDIEELTRRYPGINILVADQIDKEFERRAGAAKTDNRITYVPDTFSKWFKNLTTKAKTFYSIAVGVPGLTTIASLMARAFRTPQNELWLPSAELALLGVLFLQFSTVFVLFWFIPKRKTPIKGVIEEVKKQSEAATEKASDAFDLEIYSKANESSIEFSQMWRLAWLAWAILYFAWSYIVLQALTSGKTLLSGSNVPRGWLEVWLPLNVPRGWLEVWFPLIGLFNNLSTVFLIMCYRELTFPTESKEEGKRLPLSALVAILVTIVGFVAGLEFMSGGNDSLKSIGVVTGWTGGFAAGAVIALLTGRLESRLINPPLTITVILYLYASIQATFTLFPTNIELMIIITSAAFLFKVILFLLIHWLLSSGVLIFYLAEIGVRHETTPRRRKRFVEAVQSKKPDAV
jgi:hypothetical protein